MSTPQVWIGCLAAYNNAKLHGEWVDATDAEELQEALQRVLRTSPEPGAEEWYVGDYDGFGALTSQLGEYPDIRTVAHIGALIEELGEPFLLWAGTRDSTTELENVTAEDFQQHYRGEWSSEEDYAQNLVISDGLGWHGVSAQLYVDRYGDKTINVFDELVSYIDWESIAQELFRHGNYTYVDGHVFEDEI
jgi:prepilin-type processing-associated H-X9-DG protein